MYSENCAVEKEGNIYFDIISECKSTINQISKKLNFISSGGKIDNCQKTPSRSELEAELVILLTLINELRDSIIK